METEFQSVRKDCDPLSFVVASNADWSHINDIGFDNDEDL